MATMSNIQPYREAASTIKQAILHSQYRAAKLITGEQLSLYFGIGDYISLHSRNGGDTVCGERYMYESACKQNACADRGYCT